MSAKGVSVEAQVMLGPILGPWYAHLAPGQNNLIYVGPVSDPSAYVAEIWSDNSGEDEPPTEENWAVARLIAAAPDGLALARRVLKYFGNAPIDPLLDADIEVREMARAVIRKAEERT